jgi:hypothetical protein
MGAPEQPGFDCGEFSQLLGGDHCKQALKAGTDLFGVRDPGVGLGEQRVDRLDCGDDPAGTPGVRAEGPHRPPLPDPHRERAGDDAGGVHGDADANRYCDECQRTRQSRADENDGSHNPVSWQPGPCPRGNLAEPGRFPQIVEKARLAA